MSEKKPKPIANRRDFVLLFDVRDGNPNGDPDAGNMPRIDPDTSEGLVTDVALKRKVRNYVQMSRANEEGFEIYVKEKAVLDRQHQRAHDKFPDDKLPAKKKASKKEQTKEEKAKEAKERAAIRQAKEAKEKERTAWMCENFYDIRTFGAAMMSKEVDCGQVRGPVQMTFARSVAPVVWSEHAITRMAVTTEEEEKAQDGGNRTMGKKHTIPYGLYRAHGFVSAHFAAQTGFSEADLGLFWEAIENMFDHDRSAARGEMTMRGLFVFKHCGEDKGQSMLGCAPAHRLFDLIRVKPESETPRAFDDFSISSADKIEAELRDKFGGKIELEKPKSE